MKISNAFLMVPFLFAASQASASVAVTALGGAFESGYVEWQPVSDAATYSVYCRPENGEYSLLDEQLVRDYDTYGRADIVGIKAGNYQFKIVPVNASNAAIMDQITETPVFTAIAHNRDGFAHFNYNSGVGAYNNDGTLKTGARVVYVTSATASTVKTSVITSTKGTVTECTGLQAFFKALEKGCDTTPTAVRIIGTIFGDDMDSFGSSAEGLQIKGKNSYSEMNITFEGIGNDAAIHGFGILCRNCTSVEFRNFAIMKCLDDCMSLDTDNSHIWIHNLDLFYGKPGSASDQAKGDGTIDLKDDSQYITVAYNHLYDSGKASLCGMKSESGENFITYHHNWFDHSDSRHPRVRTMSVHIFNNYYDGCAKYGVGATMGSSIFVEANYFRNTSKPMMSSKQGTDALGDGTFSGENGGIIKSFGNYYTEKASNFALRTYQSYPASFDCYEATTRDEAIASSITAVAGGSSYTNFDTDASKMYSYTADKAEDVKVIVTSHAGRTNGGDFAWTFSSSDDTSYAVDTKLQSAVYNYKSSLVKIFPRVDYTTGIESTKAEDSQNGAIFDLMGRQIEKPAQGIYIRNGKKYIVK